MARNWKVGEAVRALQLGSKEDKADIGRRFPLFSQLAVQANEAGVQLLECVPDYCTARKIESVLKGDINETSNDDAGDTEDDEDVEETTKKGKAKADEKPAKGKDKKAAKIEKEEEPEDEDEEEDEEVDLKDLSAKELFDRCKAAGIKKVEPKQKKGYYIELLMKANATVKKDAEEEDWDEEEEDEKPAKSKDKKADKGKDKGKGKEKASSKKDEDEDDWDI